jgi:drug/metabolite transporter (DMT)-like permease
LISKYRVDLALLGVAMVWGASYLVAKSITPFASVPAMLAIRFTLAGLIMMAVWLFRREPFSRADVVLGTLFGVTQASIMLVETYGLKETSATNAGLLISLTLVFTPILESAWSRNWLPKTYFIAVTVSIVGVLLLVSGNGFKEPNFGDFLMLLAALIRTFHVTAQGRFTKGRKVSSFNAISLQMLVCGLIYFVLDVPGTINALETFEAQQWSATLFLILFCTIFAFATQLWAIRKTSASRASLLLSTEPVWAVVIAAGIGGELLGPIGILGAALIIGASMFGQRIEARFREGLSAS